MARCPARISSSSQNKLRRVRPAPARVAPWQIPAGIRGLDRGHIVDAGRAPRITSQQPRERHPPARPQTETAQRFVAIDRTRRQVPAVVADEWRERVAIGPYQPASGQSRNPRDRPRAIRTHRRMLHVTFLCAMPIRLPSTEWFLGVEPVRAVFSATLRRLSYI